MFRGALRDMRRLAMIAGFVVTAAWILNTAATPTGGLSSFGVYVIVGLSCVWVACLVIALAGWRRRVRRFRRR